MPSILDSCPKAGATVVRSSWPRRVVGFVAVSGRIVAYASAARWRAHRSGDGSSGSTQSRPSRRVRRALQSLALPQSWPGVRYSLGVARAGRGPWCADARGPRRAARGCVSTAAAPRGLGSAAIVLGLSARRPRPRVAPVAASRAGPESAPWNLRAWLFGFWPHFVLIDFFWLVLLPIGMHRSYSWCRP